jgi:37-kD nucleoid-associated bacterial protein
MLLSESQRLYKVGILIERATVKPDHDGKYDGQHYYSFLFDHLLTGNEVGKAAAYFYDGFLGFSITSSSRQQTRIFFEETMQFINTSRATEEEKYTYREAVRSELKNQTATLNLEEFVTKTFPEEMRAPLVAQVKKQGFPGHSILKDTEYIKAKLRKPRNVLFTSGVQIRVPTDREFKELVSIRESADGFTEVRIAGAVENRE